MSNDAAPVYPGFQPPPPAPAPLEPLALSWVHPLGMVGLSIKNFLLRIVTLGIYHFWGKTEVRKRIWSAIRINGEPLQYTGTGKEMFIGFLLVLGVIVLPVLLLTVGVGIVFGPNSPINVAFQFVTYVAFFYLIGVGTHRAVRYRMSRTNWRGIRGGLDGSAWQYGWVYFGTGILLVASLGWASPWRTTKLQGLITNDMKFGNRPFRFDASSGPLYLPFAVLWFSTILIAGLVLAGLWSSAHVISGGMVFGPGRRPDPSAIFTVVAIIYLAFFVGFILFAIVSAWYRAKVMNHFAAHTSFEDARFSGNATGAGLVWLSVTNMLMVLLTLGLLAPVAQARSARYFVEHLRLDGSAALAQILQRASDAGTRGEGLAQAFDIDAF